MCRQSNQEYGIDLNRNVQSQTIWNFMRTANCLFPSICFILLLSMCSMALHTQFVAERCKKRRRRRKVRHLYFHYSIARIFGMFECTRRFRTWTWIVQMCRCFWLPMLVLLLLFWRQTPMKRETLEFPFHLSIDKTSKKRNKFAFDSFYSVFFTFFAAIDLREKRAVKTR